VFIGLHTGLMRVLMPQGAFQHGGIHFPFFLHVHQPEAARTVHELVEKTQRQILSNFTHVNFPPLLFVTAYLPHTPCRLIPDTRPKCEINKEMDDPEPARIAMMYETRPSNEGGNGAALDISRKHF